MPPRRKSHPYKRRTNLPPQKITSSSPLIDLCESPSPSFPHLETAELVKISPLEVDTSHEVTISRIPNPNFITPPIPRFHSNLSRPSLPVLNPSFSNPPRISTRVFTTLDPSTDDIPTVLYSHPWNPNSDLPSFATPANSYRCSTFPNPLSSLSIPQPSPYRPAWINPYEPRPSLGSFNHCCQVNYTTNNWRIECAGYVNRYFILSLIFHIFFFFELFLLCLNVIYLFFYI